MIPRALSLPGLLAALRLLLVLGGGGVPGSLGVLRAQDVPSAPTEPVSGDAVIRAPAGGSEIVVTTTRRLAGAIHSLTWNGREFIDSTDHGRQLQSASNLDFEGPMISETFNPTEAGSFRDGAGPVSSSRLLHLRVEPGALQSTIQMAFWLRPDGKSLGNPARNRTVLSDHLLTKRVRIGYRDLPHVLSYDVTFGLPIGEHHKLAQFEALTGYMPPEFSRFEVFNGRTGLLEPLTDGPGEQRHPVVFSVPEGTHAMGVYAPPQPAPDTQGPSYGRFRFEREKVVKWNCVFRRKNPEGITPADFSFRLFTVVGDRETVSESLRVLHREFEARP